MTKVLIVDDNQNNRLTLELLLEDIKGLEVSEATNGQEAVELCKNNFYELIFMDIMMPIMDGIEATKIIKGSSKESMIIALSALDDKESKHKMLVSGAEDYLTKPIDSELFSQRIKNYLNIILLRKKAIKNTNAINPFSTEVYDRILTFNIKSEHSLVQFWDYFLKDNLYTSVNLSDYVRVIYGFSLWLIKYNIKFSISIEENENKIFFIIEGIHSISKKVIHNIVQKHLPGSVFFVEEDNLSFELDKNGKGLEITNDIIIESSENIAQEANTETTKEILAKTHYDNPTAEQYVQDSLIVVTVMPKIDTLEDIEKNLDDLLLDFEKNTSQASMEEICEKLDDYYNIIELLTEFEHLVYGIKSLIIFLRSITDEKLKQVDKIQNFVTLLLHLFSDLSSWRKTIFVRQDTIDIHYLDASLLSSCLQIEAFFEDKEIEEGDDLEFF